MVAAPDRARIPRRKQAENRGYGAVDLVDVFLSQVRDPFRIGLMIALVLTMQRTRGATGTWVPLAAGVLFVAVIIPMTLARPEAGGMTVAIGVGLLSNAVLLAVILGILALWQRLRGRA